jgi:hypothetical protein
MGEMAGNNTEKSSYLNPLRNLLVWLTPFPTTWVDLGTNSGIKGRITGNSEATLLEKVGRTIFMGLSSFSRISVYALEVPCTGVGELSITL